MITQLKQRLLLAALGCLPVAGGFAASWAYVGYYPWTYSAGDGWLYQTPIQKVWQNGAWELHPWGDAFDIDPLFESPLTTVTGTDGANFIFRFTFSADFPRLGLLEVGDFPTSSAEPVVYAVEETEAYAALDLSRRPDRPAIEQEGRFDSTYLVQLFRTHDDVLGRAVLYFQAERPVVTWADRGPLHGMMQLRFASADGGRFVVAGNLASDAGLEAFRGAFKAQALEPPPPPSTEPPPGE